MEQLKARLRAAALDARRRLSARERSNASAAIVERLLSQTSLQRPGHVLLYAAMEEEVDLAGAIGSLRGRGARTLFPRVRGERLELVAASDLLTLHRGYRGIREPSGPRIDPEVVDVAVVPGVAFDPHGTRLGHGGGHYDRLLAHLPDDCLRVGACFSAQVVPRVPRAEHDEPVDLVITERARYRTHARELHADT